MLHTPLGRVGLAASLEFLQLQVPFPSEGRTVCAPWIALGPQGLWDEAHQTRHDSLDAPGLLQLCEPLSKYSACHARPVSSSLGLSIIPVPPSLTAPGPHRTLSCTPAACWV